MVDPLSRRLRLRHSDLRGMARLATDGTTGLTNLVEAVHARIARMPGLGEPHPRERTRGMTGLVYGAIRSGARAVGGGIDSLLNAFGPSVADEQVNPQRDALLAVLNGVLGDHLAATANPLAIPMAFRHSGQPLVLESKVLSSRHPKAGGRLLVLLHGLCMTDLQWQRNGHDHGAALARDLGFTPIYLQYNSGLHISVNGQALAGLMEQLLAQWPHRVDRLVMLGHSMGGLVARSALHSAQQAGQRWPGRLDDLVFLGTPHHGAPLERAGHVVDILLGATPFTAPFARLGKLRSAGITDLRHGSLVDADWSGRDHFARGEHPQPIPLPATVRCHAAAASLGRHEKTLTNRVLGDGLVPLRSALGRHHDPARALNIPKDRQWIGHDMGHLDLLNHPAVYAQLRHWLGGIHPARRP